MEATDMATRQIKSPAAVTLLRGRRPHHPIVLVPGFMSSGLEVVESSLRPDWVGQRVWLDLPKLGVAAMEDMYASFTLDDEGGEERPSTPAPNNNMWLKHLCLEEGGKDPEGIVVRPVPGLEGVLCLDPGVITGLLSYVMKYMVEELQRGGYGDSTLVACPYDWRIAPRQLQERDGYFTALKEQCEATVAENGGEPVALVGHSMGCRTAHYFLNWVRVEEGQSWIDTHIYSFVPLSGPFLGAPKALRAMVTGDAQSLEAFVNKSQELLLGRSLSSGPWLLPLQRETPFAFLRRSGRLRVDVTNVRVLQERREPLELDGKTLCLEVVVGEDALRTNQLPVAEGEVDGDDVVVPLGCAEVFQFLTSGSDAPGDNDVVRVKLVEVAGWTDLTAPGDVARGEITSLGELLTPGEVVEHTVTLMDELDRPVGSVGLNVTFLPVDRCEPPTAGDEDHWWGAESQWDDRYVPGDECPYQPVTLEMCLREECLPELLGTWEDLVDAHPNAEGAAPGPHLLCAPPPVSRVLAIYGVDLPTEKVYFFRHTAHKVSDLKWSDGAVSRSTLQLVDTAELEGCVAKGGICREEPGTSESWDCAVGELSARTGDGTVPYSSLRHPIRWAGDDLEVEVQEIPGAEHREILAHAGMHFGLLSHVTRPAAVSCDVLLLRAEGLSNADYLGSSDPFCAVTFPDGTVLHTVSRGNTTSPVWESEDISDYRLVFGFPDHEIPSDQWPRITVRDSDTVTSDFLGAVPVDWESLLQVAREGGELSNEITLDVVPEEGSDSEPTGCVTLRYTFTIRED